MRRLFPYVQRRPLAHLRSSSPFSAQLKAHVQCSSRPLLPSCLSTFPSPFSSSPPLSRPFSATAASPAISPSLLVPHPRGSPLDLYVQQLKAGDLRPDIRQEATMKKLHNLWQRIERWEPAPSTSASPARPSQRSGSGLFSFARSIFASPSSAEGEGEEVEGGRGDGNVPKGLYLWGGVGCGKTMMMDLFYHSLSSPHKAREHFHSFMLFVHAQLHELRQSGSRSNPLPIIAQAYAAKVHILCLDEFQVTDVADAMILRLLFTSLWQAGTVVVATSNRPPVDLYKNGINRDVFVPFIDELQRHCDVHQMDAGQDHRLLGTIDHGVYHYPLDDRAEAQMKAVFSSLSKGETPAPSSIKSATGRSIPIPLASKQAALFSFQDLCEKPLGAADYEAIARHFPYVLVERIPGMKSNERDKIRRFITLLDVLYDRGTRLIVSAEAKPAELFRDEDGKIMRGGEGVYDEQFASGRAVSRLIEMQSEEFVKRHQARNDATSPDE